MARAMKKAIAKAEEAGEEVEEELKESTQISEELQAWYDDFSAKETEQVQRIADEMMNDPKEGEIVVPQEEMEKILEEVIDKEGLENNEVAQEYFDSIWE